LQAIVGGGPADPAVGGEQVEQALVQLIHSCIMPSRLLKKRKDSAQYEQDFYSFCHISALGCVTQHRLRMRCEGYEMLHLVYVEKAGAYTNAMASTFNGFPPPAVIVA
jgi:hypothetical protein